MFFSFAVHYWDRTLITNTEQTIPMDPEHVLYKIFEMGCPVTEKILLRHMAYSGVPYAHREEELGKELGLQ